MARSRRTASFEHPRPAERFNAVAENVGIPRLLAYHFACTCVRGTFQPDVMIAAGVGARKLHVKDAAARLRTNPKP